MGTYLALTCRSQVILLALVAVSSCARTPEPADADLSGSSSRYIEYPLVRNLITPTETDSVIVFASLNVLEEAESGSLVVELFPVAQYKMGEYSDATMNVRRGPLLREKLIINESFARSVVNAVPRYRVNPVYSTPFWFEAEILSSSLFYDCSELIVGKGNPEWVMEIDNLYRIRQSKNIRSSFRVRKPGGEVHRLRLNHSLRELPAIGSNYALDHNPWPTAAPMDSGLAGQARKEIVRAFAELGNEDVLADSARIIRAEAYDLDRDGASEYLVIGEAQFEPSGTHILGPGPWQLLLWLRMEDGRLTRFDIFPKGDFYRSWPTAITDQPVYVLDISGDGHLELVLKIEGYEGSGYQIWEYRDRQFHLILDRAGQSGC